MSATTTYLSETVGTLLSQGIAATVSSQPADPVEYLAEWLLRRVEADQQRDQHAKDKKQQHDQELRRMAQEQEAQQEHEAALAARAAAIQGLASMVGDPQDLWQAAVNLAKAYTSAAAVYVATIADEEQPDWAAPDDPDADVETEDEPFASGEGAEAAAEGEDEAAADAGEDEAAAADDSQADRSSTASGTSPPDYSNKLLRYVAASPGQEFLTSMQLQRPRAADDEVGQQQQQQGSGSGSDAERQTVPVTFRVLDERLPLLEVPAAAAEPRIKFLKGLPKVGGYTAVAVPAGPVASGCFHAVLAADSLLPEGHGQALCAEDVTVLWELAQALGKALDTAAAAKRTEAARGGGAELLAELTTKLKQLRKAAAAPVAVPEVGEEPPLPEVEEGAELPPSEAVSHAEADLQHCEQVIAAGKAAAANASAALELEKEALSAIVQAISSVRGTALRALKLFTTSPPATFHVLRAVLLLLGQPPEGVATWREASQQLHLGLFDQIAGYDATQDRDAARWKLVRGAYKAVQNPKDLERELPQCALGAMLLSWIKQVRSVSRKAAALRAAQSQLAAAEADKATKEGKLTKAKEAQVKAEADEAAAVAAAAEQEEEEEEQNGGDDAE